MPADCAVSVNESECGVLAVGRCTTCGRAICPSHRAIGAGGGAIVNLCVECQATKSSLLAPVKGTAEIALQERKVAVLSKLKAAGNPGLVPRRVPGRYHLSPLDRMLGRVGRDLPVDVEPAWPLGKFSWVRDGHGVELDTGYTPTGRIVPMEQGTEGDSVEILYRRRRLWSTVDVGYRGRTPSLEDIVNALERHLKDR